MNLSAQVPNFWNSRPALTHLDLWFFFKYTFALYFTCRQCSL